MFVSPNINQEETRNLSIEKTQKQAWWDKKAFITAAVFSAFWLAFIWDYLFSSGWWASRNELSPAEFIGGLCGLFLPIFLSFLIASYFDRTAQISFEAQTIRSYLNDLIYPTDTGAVYTRTLTGALREQVQEFKRSYSNAANQTHGLKAQLHQWSEEINQSIQQLNLNTTASIREITASIEKLSAQTVLAGKHAQQSATNFNEQTVLLKNTIKESSQLFSPILSSIQKYTTDLKHTEGILKETDFRTQETLSKTKNISLQIENQIKAIETMINAYMKGNEERKTILDERLNQAKSVLELQNQALTNSENFIKTQETILAKSKQDLQEHNTKLIQAEELIKNHKTTLEESLKSSTSAIEKTQNIIETNTNNTLKTIDETLQHITKINFSLEEAGKIATAFKSPKSEEKETNNASSISVDFLQDASTVLNKLQTFSIDMAHIFTPKAEDMLWKKYYEGDKAVFMRYITRMITETQNRQIRDLYAENEEFTQAVNRYMTEFEEMTKMVQSSGDQNKLLLSILIGSDIGRLYMVLADVLKKEND